MTSRNWTCPTCGAQYTLAQPAVPIGTKPAAPAPPQGEGITEPQRKAIYAISRAITGGEERVKGMMNELYGVTSTSQLSKEQASDFIDRLHLAERQF